MNRAIILAAAGAVALLALWRPAASPSPLTLESPRPVAISQHSRKGRPFSGEASAVVVYVAGAVVHPGLYGLAGNARVDDAVRRAGGLRADADSEAVNLAQHVTDGEEIRVARIGESTPRPARARSARKARTIPANVDLNSADASALASLPGVGSTLAERIVEYRRLNGPFASLDELADVAGMTQRRIDAIAPYIALHEAP